MARNENIVALEAELERLTRLVYYDELTGILNHRGFLEEAGKTFRKISFGETPLERRLGLQIPFSLIFIDLDDFKKINDTYGHEIGDLALKSISVVLAEQLRSNDIFARWGGEEFVVALLGADSNATKIAAEKLRRAIETKKLLVDSKSLRITASFGIKTYEKEKNLLDLINSADKAMYEAKKTGKNRVVVFDKK